MRVSLSLSQNHMRSKQQRIKECSPFKNEESVPISESHKRISVFFPELQKATLNSEEHYDQKIFAISAGAIGVELAILQFFDFSPHGIAYVIISVACFTVALILNLIVHYVAKYKQDKQSDMVRAFLESDKEDDTFIYDSIRKDNRTLRIINLISIVFLLGGIVCLAIFTFVNLTSHF